MRSFSPSEARGLALDLVWSLWSELGVSGQARVHLNVGIDLEPLIVVTAYLSDSDARLRDESLDWCASNTRYVSSDRLRNYLKTVSPVMQEAFAPYSATLKTARRVSWPGNGSPWEFRPTGRSMTPDLSRPGLLQLRLRAVFGVSARAEVLRWLLDQPERFIGISELASKSLYGKDNVADTLDLLARAGVLLETTLTTEGNQRVFRLDRNAGLVSSLAEWAHGVPQQRWDAVFRIVVSLLEFVRAAPQEPASRAVAIQALLPRIGSDLRWLGTFPRLRQGVAAVNADFDAWATTVLEHWSGGAHAAPAPRRRQLKRTT